MLGRLYHYSTIQRLLELVHNSVFGDRVLDRLEEVRVQEADGVFLDSMSRLLASMSFIIDLL